jgi:hypothetical protein
MTGLSRTCEKEGVGVGLEVQGSGIGGEVRWVFEGHGWNRGVRWTWVEAAM